MAAERGRRPQRGSLQSPPTGLKAEWTDAVSDQRRLAQNCEIRPEDAQVGLV